MQSALLVKLRPAGPWRFGPDGGGASRVDSLFRSDRLFSALTSAAGQLGWGQEWLRTTAKAESPVVRLSSLFPFQNETLFVTPPATLWPPPNWMVTSPSPVFLNKIRWRDAALAPVSLVESILLGQKILADQWVGDPESGCLLRRDRPSTTPFRTVVRTIAPVDRVTGRSTDAQSFACVEFEPGAGLWFAAVLEDGANEWNGRLQAMIRLLSDTGFGGRRTSGWGQVAGFDIREGEWPRLLMPKLARAGGSAELTNERWLLSLFSPSKNDDVDWKSGSYSVVERGSYKDLRARFIAEGSVLPSAQPLAGAAVRLGASLRWGLALSLPLPAVVEQVQPEPVAEEATEALPEVIEQPSEPEALEKVVCEPETEPEIQQEPEPQPEIQHEREPEQPEVEQPATDPEPEIGNPEPQQESSDAV